MDEFKSVVIWTGLALWFASGWYLNERLRSVHDKLDRILEAQMNRARE